MRAFSNFMVPSTAKMISKKIYLTALVVLSSLIISFGQIPSGYYSTADGKTGAELKAALYEVIKGHTEISYSGLWTAFQNTDRKSNGKVWDMYSDVPGGTPPYEYTFSTDQCGTYGSEGDCYNREHSFPKSWFSDGTPMYSDLFHLYPTDGKVNGERSNWPFGEVTSPTYTSLNGSKRGPCSYPGYTGTVFEPIDEYKGDFARSYFYMVTRYHNVVATWSTDMLDKTQFPAFSTWAKNMLLEWNEQDPVSQKEIDRNDSIYYKYQHNRNPFIDHPEYAQQVWGSGYINVSFISSAITTVQAGTAYTYNVSVSGNAGATFTITATTKPSWLTLTSTGNGTATLTGTPLEANVGANAVVLHVTDGTSSKDQSFTINVTSSVVPLQFTSTPIVTGQVGVAYSYNVTAIGNSGSTFTLTAPTKPSWLTLTSTGNGTATLSGTPAAENIGSNDVVLTVGDGTSTVNQSFSINIAAAGSSDWVGETFEKMQDTPINSYIANFNWTGDNNIIWSATYARIDQTINAQAICFKDQTNPQPYLQSQNLSGGCSQIKFKHQQKFSGSGGIITLFVNDTEIGNANVTLEVQTSTFTVTGISGDFVIKIVSNGIARIAIDDVEWQSATTTPNENPEIATVTINPVTPFTGQNVSVSTEVDDVDGTIQAVSMQWGFSSDNLVNTISMTESGGLYVAQIPAQSTPTTIHYKITATDNLGGTVSFIGNFNVIVNHAPIISNVSQNPSNPTSANTTTISCQVTDNESNLSTVSLLWGLSETSLNNTVIMSVSSGFFIASIPAQVGGTVIYYTVKAKDTENLESQSSVFNYTVENATGNSRPSISNIQVTPINPVTGQLIIVSASISDSDSDGSIKKVIMGWGQTTANDNLVEVSLINSVYSTAIPSQSSAGTVYFKIYAIDNLDDTTKFNSSLTVGVNTLPSITNIIKNPSSPSVLDDVTISANVTDLENRLQSVTLAWGLNEASLLNEQIMTISQSKYSATIPKQTVGITIYYRIIAKDAENYQSQSDVLNYTVLAGNSLPSISNVTLNPSAPITGQTISIVADVTDSDGSVVKALLNWGSNSTAFENSTEMIPDGNNYLAIIPAQTQAKTVYYKILAIDNSEDTAFYSQSFLIAANQLPAISNISQNPTNPTSADNVGITAQVLDPEGRLGTVMIQWGNADNALNSQITMTGTTPTLTGSIPAQATGTVIYYRIKAFDAEGNQAYSAISNYTVSASSGIGDNNFTNVRVFPNPFGESITVEVENPGNTKVLVMDIIGKIVYQTEFTDKTLSINTGNLKAGIYIIKVINNSKATVLRVVKR